jgi:hypothetical protein
MHNSGTGVEMKLIGIILVVFGIVALIAGGISYTKRDTVVDIGPLKATTERQKTVPLPPLVGLLSLAAGVVLIIADTRTRA